MNCMSHKVFFFCYHFLEIFIEHKTNKHFSYTQLVYRKQQSNNVILIVYSIYGYTSWQNVR